MRGSEGPDERRSWAGTADDSLMAPDRPWQARCWGLVTQPVLSKSSLTDMGIQRSMLRVHPTRTNAGSMGRGPTGNSNDGRIRKKRFMAGSRGGAIPPDPAAGTGCDHASGGQSRGRGGRADGGLVDRRGHPYTGHSTTARGPVPAAGRDAHRIGDGKLRQPPGIPVPRRLLDRCRGRTLQSAPQDRTAGPPAHGNTRRSDHFRLHGGNGLPVDVAEQHGHHDDDVADRDGGGLPSWWRHPYTVRPCADAGDCLFRLHRRRRNADRHPT